MTETFEYLLRSLLIGLGATLVMDLWAIFIKQVFAIPSLSYPMVGRWLGHLPRGQFVHKNIAEAPAIRSEFILGWGAHYAIGIIFSAIMLGIWGLGWARQPTLWPALLFGVATLVAPFFILQPGMGAGIAASKTPYPNTTRLRSLMAHTSYGVGIYLSALLLTLLI